jgi:hypothetical protein
MVVIGRMVGMRPAMLHGVDEELSSFRRLLAF